jgi:hypothetical protein
MTDSLKDFFVYDASTGNIYRDGAVATTAHSKGYLKVSFQGNKYLAHRLAWFLHYGKWPESQLDHINRNKTDNRIENLREATGSQNLFNRAEQSNNKSGKSGVFWYERKKRWIAYIKKCGTRINLGSFERFEDALSARLSAELRLYPEIVSQCQLR